MKEFKLSTTGNKILSCYLWDDVEKPVGVIQLVHGSAEHMGRYDGFAQDMNKKGFIVIGDDHRGHGKTADDNNEPLGYFAKHHGWKKIVDDELVINNYINRYYNELPIFMLGHSMGSFIARNYAIKFSNTIDGLILSGTTDYPKSELILGEIVAEFNCLIGRGKKPGKLIHKLSYSKFNNKFAKDKKNLTGSEWQTRNQEIQEEFQNDPKSGFVFTNSGFKDMFDGLLTIQKKRNIELTRKSLPILIISGLDDPVGFYGKGVEKVSEHYEKLGYNVEMILYPNLRHEILFEPEHRQVEQDILSFMDRNIKR
ncbi:alpha/beta fold hydrolase [Mesoplasma lactucae]|uniref:Lysophospholipase n=1 Tax=Mesoplasma lactucae ATCC 49193 TaxID=81460 RepID=A0A291ISA0_9MOLU|nr:alpha/beta hydrolase [Mesoplasma lactucae]ATG97586.1 lysophospholipase [Mesoplasma lactucae ATCC 49193]ATZ19955.1 lysophospholipase [Mesoplasma lactucae ATCC 49193]MCL8217094.1 Monoacylglycerol lipase [Mesoplasma lactucae ATCC 49193]